jgi:cephalosporin-C deacetylase
MPHSDLPLEELRAYRPDVAEPADFDAFWAETLSRSRAAATEPLLQTTATPFEAFEVYDLTFSGFGGDSIRAWITKPPGDEPRPAVIEFIGYNGGRGMPGERLHWAAAGFVHVFMDTRGQGGGWGSGGATTDPHGTGSSFGGFMTRGIESPDTYFYRRVFTDGVLLVDVVADLPFVDAARVSVTGGSQGGGISLAVGALADGVAAVMPDVPFLCHFRRSVELTPEPPFTEIARYLGVHRDRDAQVFATLSYFDGVNFARRATAPGLFSVALMDEVVLPSSVFAAFNHYAHEDRAIEVYGFNDHDGGQLYQWYQQHAWLTARL